MSYRCATPPRQLWVANPGAEKETRTNDADRAPGFRHCDRCNISSHRNELRTFMPGELPDSGPNTVDILPRDSEQVKTSLPWSISCQQASNSFARLFYATWPVFLCPNNGVPMSEDEFFRARIRYNYWLNLWAHRPSDLSRPCAPFSIDWLYALPACSPNRSDLRNTYKRALCSGWNRSQ